MSILTLDEVRSADKSVSGGKAYNCALLKQAGFPVPDGVVIPPAFPDQDLATLARHPWFERLSADELFAVRSSGLEEDGDAQSFAGVHETRLNVRRGDLAEAVRACRASASSDRAIAYRRSQGLPLDSIQTAVLIQRMISPASAGVVFTINPLTGDAGELVINSSTGLGEALVSGLVDPDEFIVRKSDRAILFSRVGTKGNGNMPAASSLEPKLVAELAGLAIAIEQKWNAPQDIEWCYDARGFWIVQTRPVTGLRPRSGQALRLGSEEAPRSGQAYDAEWTRANLAEVLPELTSPQAMIESLEVLNAAERRHMGRLLAPDEVLGPTVQAFHGRLYFNLSQLRHICRITGTPPVAVMRSMGHPGEFRPDDERAEHASLGERLARIPDFVRLQRRHARADQLLREHEARANTFTARLSALDPPQLSDEQIWALIDEWRRGALDTLDVILTFGGVLGHELPLQKMCERVGFPHQRLLFSQLAAGERSVSAQQAFDLVEIAEAARSEPRVLDWFRRGTIDASTLHHDLAGSDFIRRFDRFLQQYGHRGLFETDWSLPRFAEDPAPLLHAIRAHLEGPPRGSLSETVTRQARDAAAVWQEFEQKLTWLQRWTILPRARSKVRLIKRYYVSREKCRSDMVRVLAAIRWWHLVLARRFVERRWLDEPNQYFLVLLDEIAEVIRNPQSGQRLRTLAAERSAEIERNRQIPMPLLMRESELPRLIQSARAAVVSDTDSEIHGTTVSGGSVEADVVVIDNPADFRRMKRGAILVARATDPSWTPLFTLASGVIVEVGGVLSHASTVAREFGLPALANVKNATKRFRTGERVRLDATGGVIQRLPRT